MSGPNFGRKLTVGNSRASAEGEWSLLQPPRALGTRPLVVGMTVDDIDENRVLAVGGRIFEDVLFTILPFGEAEVARWITPKREGIAGVLGLPDVMEQIRAPGAWRHTRGRGATIVVVDSGIAGSLREFAKERRSAVDLYGRFSGQHWIDRRGHGSMCAAIAAGSKRDGGKADGVAPEATVLSARTTLRSEDITNLYDDMIMARRQGRLTGPVVVTNSYGVYACTPIVKLPEEHPYLGILADAVAAGMFVSFAAGNNHHDVLCHNDPTACGPNTIWGPASHDVIFSVGTVNANDSNRDASTPHVNSSRGPGQWSSPHRPKPDCVAPTYGEIVWGASYKSMAWWGTSGACPQAAGLAALLLSLAPHLTPAAVADIIRSTARAIDSPETCTGAGVLNCEEAVEFLLRQVAS